MIAEKMFNSFSVYMTLLVCIQIQTYMFTFCKTTNKTKQAQGILKCTVSPKLSIEFCMITILFLHQSTMNEKLKPVHDTL